MEPSTCIEFLGVIIDSEKMELRISEKRLDSVMQELCKWVDRKSGSKRDLLSLLGKLVFVSKVISPGRIFMRRLYDLTMGLKHLHYRVKLNRDAREDIIWWLNCAASWNCKSVFLDDDWISSNLIHLYTDASDVGLGCIFESSWFVLEFDSKERAMIIAWRELYAIVLACFTWGQKWLGRKIIMHCDNSVVVSVVNSGTSKNRDIMCLIRVLFNICVKYNFDIRLEFIPGAENVGADHLSRLNYAAFHADSSACYNKNPTKIRRSFDAPD
jgi:hypothetical protein